MKINQLFNKTIHEDLTLRVLACFGLQGFHDRRMFCKYDLESLDTVGRLTALVPELRTYYIPCKAKMYLVGINHKKSVTVLKQIIRLHGLTLISRERNIQGKKVIYYQLMCPGDYDRMVHMTNRPGSIRVDFI